MENRQDRMLMVDQILTFLGISQDWIEESLFEESYSFERKRDYDFFSQKTFDLYSAPVKKTQDSKMKEKNRSSLFMDTEEKMIQHKPMMKKGKFRHMYMNIPIDWMDGYKILSKQTKSRNAIFTFMDSLVSIMNESFWMKNEDDKTHLLRELLKKMHAEVYIDGNYQKFFYHKTRKMKKDQLMLALSQSIQFRIHDMDIFYMMQQYAVDYFGVNLFIISLTGDDRIDEERCKFFVTRQFENRMNPLVPTLCMIWKDEIYYPIVHEMDEEKSIMCYSRDREILEKIWKICKTEEMFDFFRMEENNEKVDGEVIEEKIKVSMTQIQKMKVDELQKICKEMGISIDKISEKTGKSIKKTKTELIEEVIRYQS